MKSPSTVKTPRATRISRTPAPAKSSAPAITGLGRQAEKSLLTQTAVLEATIACLVDLGYYNTTMERIAKRAKVSRGAMMHHYRDRADVIERAAMYLAEKRLAEFEKLAKTVTEPVPPGEEPTLMIAKQGVELTRRFHSSPSFVAMHELLLAARTDKELAKVMRKCQQTINDEIPKMILRLYPFWAEQPETMLQLHDLVQFTFRGIAMGHMEVLEPERLANLENLLARIIDETYRTTSRKEASQA